MKIPLEGGGPETIARVNGTGGQTIQGADWGTDGTIVFAQRSGTSGYSVCREFRRRVERRPSFSRLISREAKSMDGPSGYRTESTSCSASTDRVGKLARSRSFRPKPVRSACWLRMRHTADWRAPSICCLFAGAIWWPRASIQRRLEISGESIVVQPGIGYQPGSASADFTLAAASGAAAMVFRDPRYINRTRSYGWIARVERLRRQWLSAAFANRGSHPTRRALVVDIGRQEPRHLDLRFSTWSAVQGDDE